MNDHDPRQVLARRLRALREEHWPGRKVNQAQLAAALSGAGKGRQRAADLVMGVADQPDRCLQRPEFRTSPGSMPAPGLSTGRSVAC